MKSIWTVLPCVLSVLVNTALGQQGSPAIKEPVPDAPLMARAPASTQWTITYAYKTAGKGGKSPQEVHDRKLRVRYSPQVLSRRVLKGGNGQLVIYTTYEAGLKSEAWAVKGYLYELPMREDEGIRVNPKGSGDFPEVYWITPENFRGTVKLKKRRVYLYETDAADPLADPAAPSHPRPATTETEPGKGNHRRAYIDPETRLPVLVDIGTETMTYQFTKAPAEFPAMDPRISQQLKSGAQ